jgi:uncharacterized NAD(P)/FAD-binding protein YdhS
MMVYREDPFRLPPFPVTMTNGEMSVTFDAPSDFQDWLAEEHGGGVDLSRWSWANGLVTSGN